LTLDGGLVELRAVNHY